MPNPSQEIIGTDGNELSGKCIVLAVTGSISAYRAPDVARILMRHGAQVFSFMSDNAEQIIHPNALEWATGNPVVTKLTGKIEHVTFTVGASKADMILVAPCTANTIGKIAHGIDDTPITSLISSALGERIPILIAPAMHESMYDQPLVLENIRRLVEAGVVFIGPIKEEEKVKLASLEDILSAVILNLSPNDLIGKNVLITTGPTIEMIDPIRMITNPSSGKMGSAIAFEAVNRGATVTVIHGPISISLPKQSRNISVRTTEEMFERTIEELELTKFDLVVAAAAAADYKPETTFSHKIDSRIHQTLTLELRATPKIIDSIKETSPETFLLVFRAQTGLTRETLLADASERLQRTSADLIAVNDIGREDIGFNSDYNELTLVDRDSKTLILARAPKRIIAKQLLNEVSKRLKN
ncbi:MAG: bifunctional phosphopantothenoylcysteine decarboxylase/phosphopantothenate--cysteine ligase CoaBC [Candidatus Bathyarchaeia archaeon]